MTEKRRNLTTAELAESTADNSHLGTSWVFQVKHRFLRSPSRRIYSLILFAVVFLVLSPLLITGRISSTNHFAGTGVFAKLQNASRFFEKVTSRKPYPLQPNVCPDTGEQPDVILFIPSRPSFAAERAAVRETWGLHARLCNIRVVFGFGAFESAEIQHETLVENAVYGDLLQTSGVVDAYHNQTRLILSFFEWAEEKCGRSKFIGKADEDTWLNVGGVMDYLTMKSAAQSVIGHFLYNERAKRLPEEKWFVTKEEYAEDVYPPFAVGQLYIFPTSLIPAVLSAAKQLKIHWLDDVFIGGQIPQLLKLPQLHISERSNLWEVQSLDCFAKYFYIIHATPAVEKRHIFYDPCMKDYRAVKQCKGALTLTESENNSQLDDPIKDITEKTTTKRNFWKSTTKQR